MKIKYLLLENFAMVKSGMGLDRLELDFTKGKNVITLIVGNNGTGKTGGILSNIHPYAGLGHLEARDDSDIIIPGKKGHKVAIFTTKKHEYYIEHHYALVSGKRKISSYIKKDGKELNSAGTVTSFLQIVEAEFQIDPNFLKLLRLGPNVKNFIALSASDRKTFISKLLADVEIYLADQKVISEKSNLLNNALKIAINKKNQLGIEDVTTLKADIQKKESNLVFYRNRKEEEIKKFYKYQGSLDLSTFDNYDAMVEDLVSKIMNLDNEINKLPKPKYLHITVGDRNSLSTYKSQVERYQNKRVELVSIRATYLANISELEEKLKEYNSLISETVSSEEEDELKEFISSLEKSIAEYEKNNDVNFIPSVNKDELSSDIDKLNMILFNLGNILSLPKYTLKYYKDNYNKFKMDLNKMNSFIVKASNKLQDKMNELELSSKIELPPVLFTPSSCKSSNKCIYYQIINNISNSANAELAANLGQEKECIEGLNVIAGNLYNIKKILSMRNPNITEYKVTEDDVVASIVYEDKSKLVDFNIVTKLLEKVELYSEYQHNKNRLNESKSILNTKTNSSKYSYKELVDKISKVTVNINNLKDAVSELDKGIAKAVKMVNLANEAIDDYNLTVEVEAKKSSIEKEKGLLSNELDKLYELKEKVEQYNTIKKSHEETIAQLDYSIKQEEDEIYSLRVKETNFNELTAEIAKVEAMYGYSEYIKAAVSSKTGIPKVHVAFYCRALKSIANDIIKEIYDGELILRDFHITDNKFDIPYYTKGANISDIRYGSQAETSVTTIALSFAILMQFLPKYNIILLDEIDGPLHQTNKEKLFAALEGQLSSIGCEQLFLITQSKMFNDYPVNIICTDSDYSANISNNKNVIFAK